MVDISDPGAPRETSRYINAGMGNKQQAYDNLVIEGDTAYVSVDYAGVEILDIAAPGEIRQEQRVYLSGGDSDLLVVDVAAASQPRLAAIFGAPEDNSGAWGMTVAGRFVYLASIRAALPFRGTWSIRAIRR